MNHDDNESSLDAVDLHAWRVPPPRAIDRADLLARALAPAITPPRRRSRLGWVLVAIVVVNAAIATMIVVLVRPDPARIVALPAGGDTDARVRALVQRLEQQKRELERRLAEIEELQARIAELSKTVGDKERALAELERKIRPLVPKTQRAPSVRAPTPTPPSTEPEALGRTEISSTIRALRPHIVACGQRWPTKGTVKARVRVAPDGSVARIDVDALDTDLGDCVAKVISGALFPRTRNGGSFGYPFVF